MPTSQYAWHALHSALGSTSSSSHSSVFPAALITSCDSLLKGLNCRCCWRSLWSACRWGWFSIFWIKFRTLTPCDRFTAECGNPGMLKSMFSSLIARLNSLSVLNDAVSRFYSGANCSLTVCALELFCSTGLPCAIVSMLNTDVVRQFIRFHRSIWRTKFFVQTLFIDLVGAGRFTFNNKHIFCVLRFPRSITDWFGFWLGWFGELCMLNFSTRLLNEFTDWLLLNCRTQFIIPSSPIVIVSQWDLWWWSRRYVRLFFEDFASLQTHHFWKTISWKYSLKDDCIRSSLIESQSFSHRTININLKYRVFMVSSTRYEGIVRDVVH